MEPLPFESMTGADGILRHGIMNAPALVILLLLTLLLIKGTQESAIVNAIIVFIKVAIVIIFIVLGWQFIRPENHTPYLIPANQPPVIDAAGKVIADYSGAFKHGWGGVLGGAAIVFLHSLVLMLFQQLHRKQKSKKRYADWYFRFIGSLYDPLYFIWTRINRGG